MKRQVLHYITLASLLLIMIFQVQMLFSISVPIKDSSLIAGEHFSVIYYLKYTSSYILFLIFGLSGFLLIFLKKKIGVFFATLYVSHELINNIFVIKTDWIYLTQWLLFILFFLSILIKESFQFYGISKKTLTNYFYVILIVLSVRYIPLIFSYLAFT